MSIFEKIKQFFKNLGKNQKLLESANEEKELQEFSDEIHKEEPQLVNEIEKVDEISEHDKFAKELADKAKEFNPELMSKEDAIMKILEEKGMNSELSKNPATKKQICDIAKDILDEKGISKITKSNIEDIDNKLYIGGLKVLEDGTLCYQKNIKENGNTNKTTVQSFKVVDGNCILQSDYREEENGIEAIRQEGFCFDKNGIEMKRYIASGSFDKNNLKVLNADRYAITRNEDLVTARVTVDNNKIIHEGNSSFIADNTGIDFLTGKTYSLEDASSNLSESLTTQKLVNTEHPQKLSVRVSSIEGLKEDIENGENTWNKSYIEQTNELSTPEAKARFEKQQESLDIILKDAMKRSDEFRKLAEEKGIVDKESAQELE